MHVLVERTKFLALGRIFCFGAARFGEGRLVIERGARSAARATIRGSLQALVDMALGGNPVLPLLLGRIRVWGDPLLLLQARPPAIPAVLARSRPISADPPPPDAREPWSPLLQGERATHPKHTPSTHVPCP